MISVQEAEKMIAASATNFTSEPIPVLSACGRILAEDLKAEREHPPFHRVCMDGIAIRFADWQAGCRHFRIAGTQGAGEEPHVLSEENACLEIMTGASLAQGTDCVIPVERLKIDNGVAEIEASFEASLMQNIHEKGSDHSRGFVLANKGQVLTGPEMGIAASVGSANVRVSRRPKVAVIATGTELVGPEAELKPWQIRRSNSTAITAVLQSRGYEVEEYHFPDSEAIMEEKITQLLSANDALILSGGVSMGKYDFVPKTLKSLGVEEKFHKIKQRPGKPLWFGTSSDKMVFGLPGNPVSSIVSFFRYILPQFERSAGHEPKFIQVKLSEEVVFKKEMTFFMPVKLICEDATLLAIPNRTNGSGDYGSLGGSDGFVELPEEFKVYEKGMIVKFYPWREGVLV